MGHAFRTYWRTYGGWVELFYSPYFQMSWFFALLLHPLWVVNSGDTPKWVPIAQGVLPSIIGFSLGSIAILISLSSGRILAVMQRGEDNSVFMKVSAAFFHFVMLQLGTLLLSLCVMSFPSGLVSYFGFFFFVYALFSGVATAAITLDIARLRNVVEEDVDPS